MSDFPIDLKYLQTLLKLCRKQGVSQIELGDVKLKFGDLPRKDADSGDDVEMPDDLSFEALAFLSAPLPGG